MCWGLYGWVFGAIKVPCLRLCFLVQQSILYGSNLWCQVCTTLFSHPYSFTYFLCVLIHDVALFIFAFYSITLIHYEPINNKFHLDAKDIQNIFDMLCFPLRNWIRMLPCSSSIMWLSSYSYHGFSIRIGLHIVDEKYCGYMMSCPEIKHPHRRVLFLVALTSGFYAFILHKQFFNTSCTTAINIWVELTIFVLLNGIGLHILLDNVSSSWFLLKVLHLLKFFFQRAIKFEELKFVVEVIGVIMLYFPLLLPLPLKDFGTNLSCWFWLHTLCTNDCGQFEAKIFSLPPSSTMP
jgi:hypothetical protein